jgi:hypothetical protein
MPMLYRETRGNWRPRGAGDVSTDTFSGHSYDTKIEAGFSTNVLPELQRLGVTVADLRDIQDAGELHVTLCLPSHDRELRETVLRLLQDFERSWAYSTSVSPTLMHREDSDES